MAEVSPQNAGGPLRKGDVSLPSKLILVRHFPVDDKSLCYGQSDPPCTVTPEQLQELQASLENELADGALTLFSSPAKRCRLIADHLAAAWNVPLVVDPLLAELSMGEFEGRRYDDLKSDERFARWMQQWKTSAPPGGETLEQLEGRVRQFLVGRAGAPAGLLSSSTGHSDSSVVPAGFAKGRAGSSPRPSRPSTALVIAHAGVVRALKVLLHGSTWEDALTESVPHAQPLVFCR